MLGRISDTVGNFLEKIWPSKVSDSPASLTPSFTTTLPRLHSYEWGYPATATATLRLTATPWNPVNDKYPKHITVPVRPTTTSVTPSLLWGVRHGDDYRLYAGHGDDYRHCAGHGDDYRPYAGHGDDSILCAVQESHPGLSTGDFVCILLASIFLFITAGLLLCCCIMRRRMRTNKSQRDVNTAALSASQSTTNATQSAGKGRGIIGKLFHARQQTNDDTEPPTAKGKAKFREWVRAHRLKRANEDPEWGAGSAMPDAQRPVDAAPPPLSVPDAGAPPTYDQYLVEAHQVEFSATQSPWNDTPPQWTETATQWNPEQPTSFEPAENQY